MRRMNIFQDKMGDDKWLSPWMFFVWIIVGGTIAAAVVMFYTASVDVRGEEANAIFGRVSECLSSEDNLNLFLNSEFDFYRKCGISEKVFTEYGNFYAGISVYDGGTLKKSVFYGNKNFQIKCFLTGRNFPYCVNKKVIIESQGKNYGVEILAGSDNPGGKYEL